MDHQVDGPFVVLRLGEFDPETGARAILGHEPGVHVNITPAGLADHPELARFVVQPTRYRRVWAGDNPEAPERTVALWFEDEAQAAAALGPEFMEMRDE